MSQKMLDQLIAENKIPCKPTLASISSVLHIAPYKLASVAKTDDQGNTLPRHQYNWTEIDAFIERRLDPDAGLNSLEDVLIAAAKMTCERYSKKDVKPKREKQFVTMPDGKVVPAREIEFGHKTTVQFRGKCLDTFRVVYEGLGQIVLESIATGELKVISNNQVNTRIRRSSVENAGERL